MRSRIRSIGWAVAAGILLAVFAPAARADVRLPDVLGDHMVLQQGRAAPIWGSADPGEQVTVQFAGQTKQTTADEKGHWRVDLAALAASDKPRALSVRGKNSI
jgi:sialate O-acetylesterase